MVDNISASQFHERSDMPDWRVLLRRIEAGFRATSFSGAVRSSAGLPMPQTQRATTLTSISDTPV